MPVVRVDDVADARLDDFRALADARRLTAGDLFLAEGRLVVTRLLTESALGVGAVLVNEAAYRALGPVLDTRPDVTVLVVPAAIVEPLTGFNIHRGCLATGRRPAPRTTADLLAAGARRFLALEGVSNPDNVGGLFRSARALGVDAIVLGPGTGDPLYRKAIRVSSAASLVLPFATSWSSPSPSGRTGSDRRASETRVRDRRGSGPVRPEPVEGRTAHELTNGTSSEVRASTSSGRTGTRSATGRTGTSSAAWPGDLHDLRAAGVPILALTPAGPETIDEVRQRLGPLASFAVLVGSEGHGLSPEALAAADARIRIPIDPRADSLNVTVAAGIALHALR